MLNRTVTHAIAVNGQQLRLANQAVYDVFRVLKQVKQLIATG